MKWRVQQEPDKCYLCEATDQPLDMHHVYGASNRKKSEQYGLTVYLCHDRCHIFGVNAVHMNREVDLYLKDKVQRIAMEHYNWTLEDWRKLFGKNYLKEVQGNESAE